MANTPDDIDNQLSYNHGFDDASAMRPPRPEKFANEEFYMLGYEDGAK